MPQSHAGKSNRPTQVVKARASGKRKAGEDDTSPSEQAGEDDENLTKADYQAMKVLALRAMCRNKNLKQTGLKDMLISRLMGEDPFERAPFKPPATEPADQPPEPPAPPDQAGPMMPAPPAEQSLEDSSPAAKRQRLRSDTPDQLPADDPVKRKARASAKCMPHHVKKVNKPQSVIDQLQVRVRDRSAYQHLQQTAALLSPEAELRIDVEETADGGRAESASSIMWKWIDGKLCKIMETTTTVWPGHAAEHMTQREQCRQAFGRDDSADENTPDPVAQDGGCAEIEDLPPPEVEEMADGSRVASASSITWEWIDGKLCKILQTKSTVCHPEHMTQLM
jgi:hypothetical protein